jgi:sn1-specific diacylglycerol lipase
LPGLSTQGKTNGLFKGLFSGDSVNPQIVAAKTGIDEEDLITTQWISKDFNPGHFMAYDHSRRTIVISIRGTFHIRDALTDLVASYEPFEDGFAHWYVTPHPFITCDAAIDCLPSGLPFPSGILHTAQRKLELLEPFLIEALRAYPEYGLVIVGHSLGAGAASLLTILLHNSTHLSTTIPYRISVDHALGWVQSIRTFTSGVTHTQPRAWFRLTWRRSTAT